MARHQRSRRRPRRPRTDVPVGRCPATRQAAYQAWRAAETARRRVGAARVYRCPECGHLHITDLTAAEADAHRARTLSGHPPVTEYAPTPEAAA